MAFASIKVAFRKEDRELLTKILEELEHICVGINGTSANSEGEEMTPTSASEGVTHD